MFKLAINNLLADRARLGISIGGIALAIVLILMINGIFAGSEEHAVAYIKNQPADYWIMQKGVANMHMSSSILPPDLVDQVNDIEGVLKAVGLLYASGTVDLGETQLYSYIFAVDRNVPFGGPWDLAAGSEDLAIDEIILDKDLSNRYGLGIGDQVGVFGQELTIAGLSEGTLGIATSVTFVNKQALASVMGVSPQSASYILVKPEEGADSEALANRIKYQFPRTTLLDQQEFIENDKEMIQQMRADIIRAMNTISYIVGILVIGLTIYTATLERAREYAVLKAIGAKMRHLILVVILQAYTSSILGGFLGLGIAAGLAAVISQVFPEMLVLLERDYIARQLPVLVLVTGVAALIPLRRIKKLDPLIVFRE